MSAFLPRPRQPVASGRSGSQVIEETHLVREAFFSLYTTPMTRRISYTEEDHLVFLPCTSDGFRSPLLPVNGVVLVLQQVWGPGFVQGVLQGLQGGLGFAFGGWG